MFELMRADPIGFGLPRLPNSVDCFNYLSSVDKPDSKAVLWNNVLALMKLRYGKENLTRLAAEAEVGPASMTRIKEAQTSVGIELVERIAKVFKVQPWQLLAPELGAHLYQIDAERRIVPIVPPDATPPPPPPPPPAVSTIAKVAVTRRLEAPPAPAGKKSKPKRRGA